MEKGKRTQDRGHSLGVQVFNGKEYHLYAGEKYYSRGSRRLHRVVWEYYNGKIPPGYQVHHKDGNPANNDIGNLECISMLEHKDRHREEVSIRMSSEESRKHLAEIRPKASEWHRSAEGREWHKEHAAGERERETKNAPVHVAESSSCPHIRILDSVQTNARQSGEETNTLMMKQESALYAERNSGQTDFLTQCAAVAVVVQDIEIRSEEEREVFDLQVKDVHEYFANGILVHNCLDATRYALWTRFGQKAGYGQYSISFSRNRYGHN